MRVLQSGKLLCDDDCLGFQTRCICAHTVATAMFCNMVPQMLAWFSKQDVNLTRLTVPANLSQKAGKKGKPRKRKSTALATTPPPQKRLEELLQEPTPSTRPSTPNTLEQLLDGHFNRTPPSTNATVIRKSDSGMKVTIKRSIKPVFVETTSTPFELIPIKGRIRKCAGCPRGLKIGPDPILMHKMDAKLCICHKERDHYFNKVNSQWKPTFSNVHYHVWSDCVKQRNTSFNYKNVSVGIALEMTDELRCFLATRFTS